MHLAVFIGYLTKPIIKKRQKITLINLKIAFPQKSDKEIKKLASESYKSACMAELESLIAWFMSEKNFKKINFDDSELTKFIDAHNDKDRATICLGFHFHTLEIVGRHSGSNYSPLTLMYQKHKNPLMEYLITSSRKKYVYECFQRKNIIELIEKNGAYFRIFCHY
jgi:KDO2-lipid IV(A) lauroyltransferase